jgi:hypothetical protein
MRMTRKGTASAAAVLLAAVLPASAASAAPPPPLPHCTTGDFYLQNGYGQIAADSGGSNTSLAADGSGDVFCYLDSAKYGGAWVNFVDTSDYDGYLTSGSPTYETTTFYPAAQAWGVVSLAGGEQEIEDYYTGTCLYSAGVGDAVNLVTCYPQGHTGSARVNFQLDGT